VAETTSPSALRAPERAKKKGLVVRLTVAPAILLVICGLFLWADKSGSSAPTDVVMVLLAAAASYEVVAMTRRDGVGGNAFVAVAFSAALAGLGLIFPHSPVHRGELRSLLLVGAVLAAFIGHFRLVRAGDLERLLLTIFPVVFVGYLFGLLREASDGHISMLLDGGSSVNDGARRMALIVVSSKASDIGGWIVGKTIGRHKMIPSVSPGKTWEGTFGGLAFSVGAAVLVLHITGPLPRLAATNAEAAVLGLVLGVASTVAGLMQSALKRRCAVKDSSPLLPEMGGILDMIDSLLLSAPAAWLWTLLR
jgi:phosphatidate cytidylyltransferase